MTNGTPHGLLTHYEIATVPGKRNIYKDSQENFM